MTALPSTLIAPAHGLLALLDARTRAVDHAPPVVLHTGDVVDWLRGRQWLVQHGHYPRAHAVLCDPPYGLAFMNQAWDTMTADAFQAWVTEWASLLLDFVYPGAVGAFFGGTRTFHRLATGLEQAGWEVFDCVMYLYGTGFPKGKSYHGIETKWHGHNVALKPSYEPIVLARAPRSDTYAGIARRYGTGALNVDGCRIEGAVPQVTQGINSNGQGYKIAMKRQISNPSELGRWPANTLLVCACESDDHDAGCPVRVLGEQSGESVSSGGTPKNINSMFFGKTDVMGEHAGGLGDTGTAARFYYTAKAAAWERSAGLDYRPPQVVNFEEVPGGVGTRKNTHPT